MESSYDGRTGSNCDMTFISIHDLSPEARILYSSDSIVDVLGYTPDEVVDRSCWEFFPPDQVPYARQVHQKGIDMDRAAMLVYCKVQDKSGQWLGCECCFTIVYDVMVVCTSIYRTGSISQKRADEAPVIRRLFSSSPQDPRYHMLSHISKKFTQPTKHEAHEPRAALFLNRFTRTLTIMYATSGLEDVIGVPADVMRGRSFYYCIAENCLPDAVKCLETAKGNDSIAYLRFWFRDPRASDDHSAAGTTDDSDEEMTTDASVDQDMAGGVDLSSEGISPESDESTRSHAVQSDSSMSVDRPVLAEPESRTSSGDSTHPRDTHEAIFGESLRAESSHSSMSLPPSPGDINGRRPMEPVELEAVISCASDGLVVCLRKARPMIPISSRRPARPMYENGLFAAPWATEPLVPALDKRPQYGQSNTFTPSLGPQAAQKQVRTGGPDSHDFMTAIRDQAIFAWALTGINGAMQRFGSGTPSGESLPPGGLPVWQSDDTPEGVGKEERTDSATSGHGSEGLAKPPKYPGPPTAVFGDPGLANNRMKPFSNG